MDEQQLERWIKKNPAWACVILPAGGIGFMMFLMYFFMQIIDSFLTGRWI